jgi:hypothetical protein
MRRLIVSFLKIEFIFWNFSIFGYLNCLTVSTLFSNHPYFHVKVYTHGLTFRSVTHSHTDPPLARLTSPFLPY